MFPHYVEIDIHTFNCVTLMNDKLFLQLDILRGIHADLATLANEVNHLLGFQGGHCWFTLPREIFWSTFLFAYWYLKDFLKSVLGGRGSKKARFTQLFRESLHCLLQESAGFAQPLREQFALLSKIELNVEGSVTLSTCFSDPGAHRHFGHSPDPVRLLLLRLGARQRLHGGHLALPRPRHPARHQAPPHRTLGTGTYYIHIRKWPKVI